MGRSKLRESCEATVREEGTQSWRALRVRVMTRSGVLKKKVRRRRTGLKNAREEERRGEGKEEKDVSSHVFKTQRDLAAAWPGRILSGTRGCERNTFAFPRYHPIRK